MAGPNSLLAEHIHVVIAQLNAVGKPAVVAIPVDLPAADEKLHSCDRHPQNPTGACGYQMVLFQIPARFV